MRPGAAHYSDKSKSYFLSNISHELRTPLNSIVSLTHALLEGTFGNLNPKQRENLEIVSESSKHLQSLINDILDLSKIELGKMPLKIAAASVDDLARSTIRMIAPEAEKKGVSCILELDTKYKLIEVDGKRIRQILLNLLINGVKFAKPNTSVTLAIEDGLEDETLRFRVSDQGIGIKPSDFAKIFFPFTQLDDSLARQYEGTGLGLAIASKFIALHGGGLRLASEPGEGSEFAVTLPTRQYPLPQPRATLAETGADPQSDRPLALVVDDNELACARLICQVARATSLNPLAARPQEILEYQGQLVPRVLFIDLSLLNNHGSDWIRKTRRRPGWIACKWVATGSVDLPDHAETAKQLGFDLYCAKPIAISLIQSLLQ